MRGTRWGTAAIISRYASRPGFWNPLQLMRPGPAGVFTRIRFGSGWPGLGWRVMLLAVTAPTPRPIALGRGGPPPIVGPPPRNPLQRFCKEHQVSHFEQNAVDKIDTRADHRISSQSRSARQSAPGTRPTNLEEQHTLVICSSDRFRLSSRRAPASGRAAAGIRRDDNPTEARVGH